MMLRLLLLLVLLVARPAFAQEVRHDIDVTLDPAARRIEVGDRVSLPSGAHAFRLNPAFTVASVTVDGKPWPFRRDGARLDVRVPGAAVVEIRYGGSLAPLDPAKPYAGPSAGEEGAILAGGDWLPSLPGAPPAWRLTVRVPAPFIAVATGALVEEGGGRSVFAEDRPVEEPSLFAGPWEVRERQHRGLRLRTYFHPEQAPLSDEFLDLTAGALDGYAARIGPYPFAGFAVVSAPLPVGYGFPALTYIGRKVLPLPFVRGQSLAHEILHTWWGNGVRVGEGGNWAEGLTTYMADYAAAEARGPEAARAMRLDWLRDYAALPPDRDAPLTAFRSKVHDASQVVGYGKATLVFHMLHRELGEAGFEAGIRRFWEANRFRDAGWADLRAAFEAASGRDLGPFFKQWLERAGAPALHLTGATVDGDTVTVTLRQDAPAYRLSVPVVVETDAGQERHLVGLDGAEQTATLRVSGTPRAVAVDPGYDLFRRLAPGEAPPTLRDVTLDSASNVVVAADGPAAEAARALAERLMDGRPRMVAPDRTDSSKPLAVIGTMEEVDRLLRLFRVDPVPDSLAGRGSARVWTARTPQGRPVLAVAGADAAALHALLRPLPHYGRQSWLVFEGAKAVDRGVWPAAESPLRRRLG